ncbi:hypothetical protein HDU82_000816 [Entophlyctis luteolus]|nr:hypothetical protein HDU82_000816 [Entophlyctis luteolus]
MDKSIANVSSLPVPRGATAVGHHTLLKKDSDSMFIPTYRLSKPPNKQIIMILSILALVIRLFRLSNPAEVVFDEVHFGGFATKYINGRFFMDVHPPLGKLIFAGAGMIGGMGSYNRSFTFEKIGTPYYGQHVPYVFMRLFPAVFGAMLVPISYTTCRNLGMSNISAVMAAVCLLFENGFVTHVLGRILGATGYTIHTAMVEELVLSWIESSVKWVGLFLVATVGLATIQNLWLLLGDTRRVSAHTFARHFAARAACLIVLPLSVYTICFAMHFWFLPNRGSGSSYMSPEFQAGQRGANVPEAFVDVAYGSIITLRHQATAGGYLHSHPYNYPTGSKQQQVTLYPYDDKNGKFLIQKKMSWDLRTDNITQFELLRNGDVVRLIHVETGKHIHATTNRPPVTDNEFHFEVSAHPTEVSRDSTDNWRVVVINPLPGDDTVKAMHSMVKFESIMRRCTLFSQRKKLPDWGFQQQEVTCAKNGERPETIWRIESNMNPLSKKSLRLQDVC